MNGKGGFNEAGEKSRNLQFIEKLRQIDVYDNLHRVLNEGQRLYITDKLVMVYVPGSQSSQRSIFSFIEVITADSEDIMIFGSS